VKIYQSAAVLRAKKSCRAREAGENRLERDPPETTR